MLCLDDSELESRRELDCAFHVSARAPEDADSELIRSSSQTFRPDGRNENRRRRYAHEITPAHEETRASTHARARNGRPLTGRFDVWDSIQKISGPETREWNAICVS